MFCEASLSVYCSRSVTTEADLQVLLQSLKVKADGLLVKVTILLDLQTRVTEDGNMVTPCGGGEVYGLGMRVKASKECTNNTEGTSARDGLCNSDL